MELKKPERTQKDLWLQIVALSPSGKTDQEKHQWNLQSFIARTVVNPETIDTLAAFHNLKIKKVTNMSALLQIKTGEGIPTASGTMGSKARSACERNRMWFEGPSRHMRPKR